MISRNIKKLKGAFVKSFHRLWKREQHFIWDFFFWSQIHVMLKSYLFHTIEIMFQMGIFFFKNRNIFWFQLAINFVWVYVNMFGPDQVNRFDVFGRFWIHYNSQILHRLWGEIKLEHIKKKSANWAFIQIITFYPKYMLIKKLLIFFKILLESHLLIQNFMSPPVWMINYFQNRRDRNKGKQYAFKSMWINNYL